MLAFAAACSASVDVLEGPGKPGKTPDGVDGGSPTQGCSFCGALELCAIDRCIDSSGTTVLAAGLRHTCQITDGELWCWGENTSGQLGLGNTSSHATPTRVGDANDWLDVAGGQHHTCGLRAPGQLWCWGENNVGQLGLGDTAPHFEPTRVGVIEDFSDVSCGGDNCCALRSGHTLYCWGDNLEGSPGQNDTPGALDVLTPSRVAGSLAIQRFSVGGAHSCAIRDDGALYCWGRNNDGELGLGSADPQRREPTRVGMDTDWRSIAAGQHHTCGVRGRGELYCWGRNDFFELGLGRGSPDDATFFTQPVRVGGDVDWSLVALGGFHTCAIKRRGELYCFGRAAEGQLGIGVITDAIASPVAIPTNTTFRGVALGSFHTCALDSQRRTSCWGANTAGQLGLGDTRPRDAPEPLR